MGALLRKSATCRRTDLQTLPPSVCRLPGGLGVVSTVIRDLDWNKAGVCPIAARSKESVYSSFGHAWTSEFCAQL